MFSVWCGKNGVCCRFLTVVVLITRVCGAKEFFRPAAIFLRLILFFVVFETETAKTFSATLTYITVAFRTPKPW